jgi:hypothetical protein
MIIRDIIEAFDTPVAGRITTASNSMFKTRAQIGGRSILFNAAMTHGQEGQEVWEVNFVEHTPGKGTTFGKTGSGNEMAVFSFVIDSLKEFVARYAPSIVEFSSSKGDENRSKLYQRMISRGMVPGYKLVNMVSGPQNDVFTLQSQGVGTNPQEQPQTVDK